MSITGRRAWRALTCVLPAWLAASIAVCLAVPGPEEILLILPALFLLCWRPVRNARRIRSAWRGGKSHRQHDQRAQLQALAA